jgi:hypothetical protein
MRYFTYTPLVDEYTTHIYRGEKVHYFDGLVVSVEDEVLQEQHEGINATEITQAEFVELVKNSTQIKAIRDMVAREIAKRYSYADEIAMLKRADTDPKKLAYEAYVAECKALGDEAKAKLGYA